jgi:K+-sensing histidine kinase KdpD
MRLHDFISKNMDVILQRWEDFARDAWPGASPEIPDLRDRAQAILRAIANDMQTTQSEVKRHDKPGGFGRQSAAQRTADSSSARQAECRVDSGFEIRSLLAEYRALRASVLPLWSEVVPVIAATQMEDMTRFNECVDQFLAEAVLNWMASLEHSRESFLGSLGHDLRQPICAVSMMAGLLERNKDLSDQSRHMASQIGVASQEITSLLTDLLDSGSHLGAKMPVTRQSMSLDESSREEIGVAKSSPVFNLSPASICWREEGTARDAPHQPAEWVA